MDDNYSHAIIFYPSTWTSIKCVMLLRLARRQNGYTLTTHTLVTVHTSRYLLGEFFDLVITFVAYLKVVDKLFTMVHIT